ncbi:MAG: LemA family protein [Novosphingobium sp.]
MAFGLVIIAVVVVLALMLVSIYNRLVGMRQTVNQGLADIDAQLRQRHDLIPNLVSTVKGYAAHEKETFDAVIEARNRAEAGGGVDPGAEAGLGAAMGKLFALAEAYPDLKASANFQALQGELADVEDKLAAARRALNAAVARYNGARESFPAVMFASAFGFQAAEMPRIGESERAITQAPKVEF